MSQQQQNIRLQTPTCLNYRNASLVRLWNLLTGKTPYEISIILQRMNRRRLFRFLKFMYRICFHDPSIEYTHERLKHYQTVLMCCSRSIMTEFLFLIDVECMVNILEQHNDIWIIYLVGLLELQNNFEVDMILNYLMPIYRINFVSNLILRLVREASNRALPTQVRQNIFDFVCANPNIILFIISQRENEEQELTIEPLFESMNPWMLNFSQEHDLYFDPRFIIEVQFYYEQEEPEPQPQHREVDAVAFVERTFPSLHPLAPARNRDYHCGICRCDRDDANEDGSVKVFRSMTCCPQMCCHDCLVRQATACNTLGNESKNTGVFVCPYARHKIPFFPPNL